jgi:biopolymer transport protein ExbD
MNLQSRSREEPEINLTSLIDVVLLLLVFFMVSTSFVRETEISLRLPQAEAQSEPTPADETLEIVVTQTGNYLVNGRELVNNERATLRAAIEKLIGDNRELPVFVRADALATHQAVVTAMDVAGQLGFVQISIATVTPSEP